MHMGVCTHSHTRTHKHTKKTHTQTLFKMIYKKRFFVKCFNFLYCFGLMVHFHKEIFCHSKLYTPKDSVVI